MVFILNNALETVGKEERERKKILAGRKGDAFAEVNEAEELAKLMDKRMSLPKRKHSYSQNFRQKDLVSESQEPGQEQKLVLSEGKTNGRMGKGHKNYCKFSC